MLRRTVTLFLLIISLQKANAQVMDAYVHQGEVGISLGLAHYFGDLNPNSAINRQRLQERAAAMIAKCSIKCVPFPNRCSRPCSVLAAGAATFQRALTNSKTEPRRRTA